MLFKYQDADEENGVKAIENSTYLSDVEYENYKAMDEQAREGYLLELGQREWDALEEVRLMEKVCEETQVELDELFIPKILTKELAL